MYQLWSIRRCWWKGRSLCLALSLATHPLLLCPALTRFTWLFNNFKIKGGFLVDFLPMSLFSLQQAASGFIYPLERGLIFIYKPPIFVKYEDVQSINFARYENSLLELAWKDLTKRILTLPNPQVRWNEPVFWYRGILTLNKVTVRPKSLLFIAKTRILKTLTPPHLGLSSKEWR